MFQNGKFFVVVIALVMMCAMLFFMPKPLQHFVTRFPSDCEATIYCRATSVPNATNLGGSFAVSCPSRDVFAMLRRCSVVDGTSFRFAGGEKDFLQALRALCAENLREQKLDGLRIVCGFSPKLSGGVFVDGVRVNFQAAFDGEFVTIGSPLILGAY